MKKLISSIFLLILFLFNTVKTTYAIYDPQTVSNNIYGISIANVEDVEDASKLVNSNGGDWGYVTIVIPKNQMDRNMWQGFFDKCREKHLIPIVRIASEFDKGNWKVPMIEDIDSWVNFLNSLNWVIENRYVVVGNEPNHSKEWGGKINPEEYAIYLKTFSERLKNSGNNYFVLNAALDQDSPNTKLTMDEKNYLQRMIKEVPELFSYIDGWNSHSYPNPAFSGKATDTGRRTVKGYQWELDYLKSLGVNKSLPVFITETGWVSKNNNESQIADNYVQTFNSVWSKDEKIVAVTPFILNYMQEPFSSFSWRKDSSDYYPVYNAIKDLQKIKGSPKQKVSGQIIFNFLNPFGFRNRDLSGFTVVRNTGQAIWDWDNLNIINKNNNQIKVTNIESGQIFPYSTGLVLYSLKLPENQGLVDVNLGLFVNDNKVGDVFSGKIISF